MSGAGKKRRVDATANTHGETNGAAATYVTPPRPRPPHTPSTHTHTYPPAIPASRPRPPPLPPPATRPSLLCVLRRACRCSRTGALISRARWSVSSRYPLSTAPVASSAPIPWCVLVVRVY